MQYFSTTTRVKLVLQCIASYLVHVFLRLLDASRRGKKGACRDYFRDTNEGTYRGGEGGEEPPDLSYY